MHHDSDDDEQAAVSHHTTTMVVVRDAFILQQLLDVSGRPNTVSDYEKALEAIKLLTESVGRVLDVSGRPNTASDYKKALEAIKLLTESVRREPLKSATRALFVKSS